MLPSRLFNSHIEALKMANHDVGTENQDGRVSPSNSRFLDCERLNQSLSHPKLQTKELISSENIEKINKLIFDTKNKYISKAYKNYIDNQTSDNLNVLERECIYHFYKKEPIESFMSATELNVLQTYINDTYNYIQKSGNEKLMKKYQTFYDRQNLESLRNLSKSTEGIIPYKNTFDNIKESINSAKYKIQDKIAPDYRKEILKRIADLNDMYHILAEEDKYFRTISYIAIQSSTTSFKLVTPFIAGLLQVHTILFDKFITGKPSFIDIGHLSDGDLTFGLSPSLNVVARDHINQMEIYLTNISAKLKEHASWKKMEMPKMIEFYGNTINQVMTFYKFLSSKIDQKSIEELQSAFNRCKQSNSKCDLNDVNSRFSKFIMICEKSSWKYYNYYKQNNELPKFIDFQMYLNFINKKCLYYKDDVLQYVAPTDGKEIPKDGNNLITRKKVEEIKENMSKSIKPQTKNTEYVLSAS